MGDRDQQLFAVRMATRAMSAGLALVVALGGCVDSSFHARRTMSATRRDAMSWLQRVTFGLDTITVADYDRVGRERFLNSQLHPTRTAIPPAVESQIEMLDVSHVDPEQILASVTARRKSIGLMADGPAREQARKELNEQGNRLAYQAIRRDILRAVYSPDQLQEQMVWFWLNHFNVFKEKRLSISW